MARIYVEFTSLNGWKWKTNDNKQPLQIKWVFLALFKKHFEMALLESHNTVSEI